MLSLAIAMLCGTVRGREANKRERKREREATRAEGIERGRVERCSVSQCPDGFSAAELAGWWIGPCFRSERLDFPVFGETSKARWLPRQLCQDWWLCQSSARISKDAMLRSDSPSHLVDDDARRAQAVAMTSRIACICGHPFGGAALPQERKRRLIFAP